MTTSTDGGTPRAVIITGGGTGIGRATARAFAEQGDDVLIVGRTKDNLEEAAEGHDRIRTLPVDITAPDGPGQVVAAALREFGRVDVLVNNAAAAGFGGLEQVTPEHVRAQIDTNLLAPVFLTREALDALAASRGAVVNISTAGSLGMRSWPGNDIYGASKVALDFLTRTWAVELAPRGIRVVAVAPGVINTGIGERMGMPPEAYQGFLTEMAGKIPGGRVGEPEEIAWWILQLVRPEAGYVTGTVLALDGGLSLT